ncbi:mucin-13b [Sander lucioperca]|uniref:mucin-13b n=1 Tax=Sander lucioperca TaxID=283035 RepID=UPI00125DFA2D|nr:mucin-13b [Sander lucioperca]
MYFCPSLTVAPITTTADPAAKTTAPITTADPAAKTTAPITTTADPAAKTTAPITTTADPAAKTTAPITTTADPAAKTTAPITTTADPAAKTTAPITTTADPAAKTTAPITTTADPAAKTTATLTTTADPAGTTTATLTTTADPDGPSTTPTPTTTTTPALATTKLPDPCDGNPCGDGSTCVPRFNQSFACLCLAGENYNYDSRRCESAKVFPGQLTLPGLIYNETVSDNTSPEFQSASKEITEALFDVFKGLVGYSGSTVLALRPNKASKVWSRSETVVRADVEIIFTEQAEITTAEVTEKMKKASSGDGVLKGAIFKERDLCDKKPCDESSTTCKYADGSFTCTCWDNYIKTDYTTKICIACPSGQKAEGSKKCVNCPFGYSGFNCNESWKLVLVIVGSVLGGLLLITLILLPVVARKSSKKSSKMNKNADISHPPANKPLVNSSLANSRATSVNRQANGLSSFANAGVPKIPRATTTNSWDSRTNLEMTPNTSRQNMIPEGRNSRYYDDHDDNQYAQVRPQTNPYAQNRPEFNPYAQNQGHSNPYYTHDDGRRLN